MQEENKKRKLGYMLIWHALPSDQSKKGKRL
ncbi:Protein of unknown function [Lactobacillus delbrueckii subsp. bulgaricus]|nr:Protein of unknown function [Lactobacillus delbrueckii subsp. bulgaricus]